MEKRIIFIAFLSLFLLVSFSIIQGQVDTLWTKTFGGIRDDVGNSIHQTTDGGYVLIGCTYSFGAGENDIWLIKTDASGDTLWTKTFGESGHETGSSVQQTTDGGYILVGYTYSFGAGENDIWLIKTDASGDTLWTRTFGGVSYDWSYSVQQTTDGGYILIGTTYSFGAGENDIWLIKTNASGDTLWTKTFGGGDFEVGLSVQQTTDAGYILVGCTSWFGDDDVWLIKTNDSGDTLWTKMIGGEYGDYAYSLQQTTDGGYILAGHTYSFGAGENDIWLIKTNAFGDTLWTRTFGGISYNRGYSVQQTTDGGYILIGSKYSYAAGEDDAWLIKTNDTGDTLWTKTFGGIWSDWGNSVHQTADGGYIITGRTSSFGAGSADVWLIKTTPDVNQIEQNDDMLPLDFFLQQNFPNPFNPVTSISFDLPKIREVTLKIFNILGEEVATLVSQQLPAGRHTYDWDGSNVASGIYLYRLETEEYVETKKMVLMK